MKNSAYKILGYASEAVETAMPYAEKIGNYAKSTAKSVNRNFLRTRKEAKRRMKIVKIKQYIELASNIVLLAAAVIALVMALFQLSDYNDR